MLAALLVVGRPDDVCSVLLELLLDPLIEHHVMVVVQHAVVIVSVIDEVVWLVLHLIVLGPLVVKLIVVALLVVTHAFLVLGHLRLAHHVPRVGPLARAKIRRDIVMLGPAELVP